jgi:hypothetical protein
MKTSTFQHLWIPALILSCLVVGLTAGSASGLETFLVGGEARPWKETVWGAADPGAVIEVIDFESQPGWIALTEMDTTENIALKTYERGGKVQVPNVPLGSDEEAALEGLVNGDLTVAFERKSTPAKKVNPYGVLVDLDLGARFGVDRIRFFPRMSEQYPFQDDFMRAYEVYLNDDTEETTIEGRPLFATVVEHNEKNSEPIVDIEVPLQYARYLRIKSLTQSVGWEIDEIEVFGGGFVPEATYLSRVFDFGDVATLGRIWWSERKIGDPTKSQIIVRTRSGSDDTPLVYYRKLAWGEEVEVTQSDYDRLDFDQKGEIRFFTTGGQQVSKRDYEALSPQQKGAVKYYRAGGEVPFDKQGVPLTNTSYESVLPTERGAIVTDRENGWSGWSAPYDYREVEEKGGVFVGSPSPRRYFQFRIDLKSNDLRTAGSVDFLAFEISRPPAAHEIVAEITPPKVVPGALTLFTYSIKPTIRKGVDTGFDRLEIDTPTRIDTVVSVTIDGQEVDFECVALEKEYFAIGFPKITADHVLKVAFEGVVLRYGTLFTGRVYENATGELKQSVVAGDATPDIATNDIAVQIALGGSLIRALKIAPNPFTPNGDGINDDALIRYDLLQLTREMPLSVKIYTLSGALVRRLSSEKGESDIYLTKWDGKNDDGDRVPPGVYIVRVSVDTDSGGESKAGTVSVVY